MVSLEVRYLKCYLPMFDDIVTFFFLVKSHNVLQGSIGVRLNFFISLSTDV